ncbi:MAG TPA: zf-HC2 domain-containing protein [Ktedonobacteraceae bacterium]|nr:zf-HC2 domain-containing protein [Ktedonobacteraceae bacterium]
MNCEQVEERLSAYLDNMLAPDERRAVTLHLQTCSRCMTLLAELRQNDMLLSQLPRVKPPPALRARFFAIPEVREALNAAAYLPRAASPTEPPQPFVPPWQAREASEPFSQPQLVVLPGGYGPRAQLEQRRADIPPTPPTMSLRPTSPLTHHSRKTQQYYPPRAQRRWFTPLKIAIAAALLVALGSAGLVSLSLRRHPDSANLSGAITPPSGPLTGQAVPLAAGSRFIFLRDGALWSTLADGSNHQPERLTPAHVTVASGWVVNPRQGNHVAGDLLAYIDTQSSRVHTIRSDGQQDTAIQLALLLTNNVASWQGGVGQLVLKSLAWSPDSSMLAFVADPTGSGQTSLYLATLATGSARKITSDLSGTFARPVWSPDGTRLAFTLTHNGVVSVLDYNVQSQSVLDLSNLASAQGNDLAGVFALNWFSNAGQEAVTWCLGSPGHISSVWVHWVGANSTVYPQRLVSGDYLQALYSPGSNNETGGWLLLTSSTGQASDIWRLDLSTGGQPEALSQGKQVNFARWSPDGATVFYLDNVANGVGNGHLVNVVTRADQLLPDQAALSPAPDWSADGLQLAYSTGTQINVVHTVNGGQLTRLSLRGQITNLSWSPSALHQLLITLGSPNPGLYLIDTRQNTSRQLGTAGTDSAVQWTEIP